MAFLALCPATALAQTVFFDDFEGNALLPHWRLPPPSDWEYNVSNSMLNVTGLLFPSHPKSSSNFTSMGALFSPQADFRMDAWMGWEAGDRPHRLGLEALGGATGSGIIATFRYANEAWLGPTPVILAGAGGQAVVMPAPPPGIYQFTITRVRTQYEFYLDGNLFARLRGSGIAATGVGFDFLGPYPGQFGPFHIDRVQVVPAPGALFFALPVALTCIKRRRR